MKKYIFLILGLISAFLVLGTIGAIEHIDENGYSLGYLLFQLAISCLATYIFFRLDKHYND